MNAAADASGQLAMLVGASVRQVERAIWGFEKRTDILTLDDGLRLVLQRFGDSSRVRHALRLMRVLPDLLATVGIRAPHVIVCDRYGVPPYVICSYLDGAPGPDLVQRDPIALAREMGVLLCQLGHVPIDAVMLPMTWADPLRLAQVSYGWLARCRGVLDRGLSEVVATTIAEVPARFAGRGACFAHGDFCPVNVVRLGPGQLGLLDLDGARVADALFDVAWWGWVVRYHHADRWGTMWPVLLDSAGIVNDAMMQARIAALQQLQCLERIDRYRRSAPTLAVLWAQRLAETVCWG